MRGHKVDPVMLDKFDLFLLSSSQCNLLIVKEIISAWHHTRAAKLGLFQADEDLGDPLAPTEGMQLAPRPPCTGTDTELTKNNETVKTT